MKLLNVYDTLKPAYCREARSYARCHFAGFTVVPRVAIDAITNARRSFEVYDVGHPRLVLVKPTPRKPS